MATFFSATTVFAGVSATAFSFATSAALTDAFFVVEVVFASAFTVFFGAVFVVAVDLVEAISPLLL